MYLPIGLRIPGGTIVDPRGSRGSGLIGVDVDAPTAHDDIILGHIINCFCNINSKFNFCKHMLHKNKYTYKQRNGLMWDYS